MQQLESRITDEVSANAKKGLCGEKDILLLLASSLPSPAVIIHDPTLLHYEADILVIEETIGFMFIEVKTWNERYITKFHANGSISFNKKIENPLKQAENYREELKRLLTPLITSSYKQDMHRLISSIAVFNSISEETFLNRTEVRNWEEEARRFFLSKHFFYSGDPSGLYEWMLNSKKFKRSRVSDCFSEGDLNRVVEVLFQHQECEIEKNVPKINVPTISRKSQEETLASINALVREDQSARITKKQISKRKSKKKLLIFLCLLIPAAVFVLYIVDGLGYEDESYVSPTDSLVNEPIFIDLKDDSGGDVYNYFILTDSQYSKLSEDQLYGLTKSDLRIARNEIYARHGYVFESSDLQNYFTSQTWYISDDAYNHKLTDIEQHNVTLIKSME